MCCGRTTLGVLLWLAWCGRATLGYSGIHSGECAVEELLWATQGPLWGVCCGRATLGYSGIHSGECAVEELSWATGRAEVQSSKNLTTPQSYGWENMFEKK